MSEEDSGRWRVIGRVALILGMIASIATVLAFVVHGTSSTSANNLSGAQASEATATALALNATPSLSPTPSPIPLPTQTPTPLPTPAPPGTVLYRADQSTGWSGWDIGGPWKVVNGVLLNDGTGPGFSCGVEGSLTIPFQPQSANIEIIATIDLPNGQGPINGQGLGLTAREGDAQGKIIGYTAGLSGLAGPSIYDVDSCNTLAEHDYSNLSIGTHILRFDLNSTELRFYIDGGLVVAASDAKYLSAGKVSFYASAQYMKVIGFKVIQL